MNEILFIIILLIIILSSFLIVFSSAANNRLNRYNEKISKSLSKIPFKKTSLTSFILLFFIAPICFIAYPGLWFIVLILIGYSFQILFFPFYVFIGFIDIIYISVFLAIISALFYLWFLGISRKKFIILDFSIFLVILHLLCHVESTQYVKKVAKNKYNVSFIEVNINLAAWTHFNLLGIGSPHYKGGNHAEIEISGQKCHWSFRQRDFDCN